VQNISTSGLFLSKKSVFSWQIIEFLNDLLEFFENLLEFFFGFSFFGLEFFSKCPKKKPDIRRYRSWNDLHGFDLDMV